MTALLRPIRRRLRAWAALEGAVRGGAIALIAIAATVAVRHHGGEAVSLAAAIGVAVAGLAGGALARGLRRVPLARCARFADAALDGEDRVLSALSLDAKAASGPLGRALIADAAARLAALAPARAVPARRPRGGLALAAGALAAAAAGMLPVRARAVAIQTPALGAPRGRPIPRAALDAEEDAVAAAAAAAQRLDDERLAALAADFARALKALEAGTLSDGAALEALEAVAARARAAADAAARAERAFDAAQKGLTSEAGTRQAAAALNDGAADAAARARAALGAEAEAHPAEAARALSAASRGVSSALGAPAERSEQAEQRRLARDQPDPQTPSGAGAHPDDANERRLERLKRDLDDTAEACRDGAEGCRSRAEDRARDLAQLGRDAAGAEPLRRLARAARQARARLEQGDLRNDVGAGQRRFERAARGGERDGPQGGEQNGRQGGRQGFQRGDGDGDDRSQARDGDDGRGDDQAGSSSASGERANGRGEGQADERGGRAGATRGATGQGAMPAGGQGARAETEAAAAAAAAAEGREAVGADGIGSEPGGAPLGRKTDAASRGQEAEARVADGAGPNRAEVIGVAAGRGFASPGYARVFSDYQAAMEDALGATAVPEGKRYLVRRYFDLIRPRAPGRRP